MFVAMTFLMGCASLPPINTPSGRPEVTICGVGKSEMMEKTVAALSMDGFNIERTSNFQAVAGKLITNPLIATLYGSNYDSTPEARQVWTFSDIGNNCTHISIVVQIVTNPGSAFERVTDVSTGKDGHQLQEGLEALKKQIESR